MPETPCTILFDNACGLCSRLVQFIQHRSAPDRFEFVPLNSPHADALLQHHRIDPAITNSVVLLDNDLAYTKSSAVLRIAMEMNEPWPLLGLLVFIPPALRDQLYDFIARHRHQWFKSPDACQVPS